MAAAIAFVVPGVPVGKGRPRFARTGGAMRAYTPEKTVCYENLVRLKAEAAMAGRPVLEGAVAVAIALFVTPPASWSRKRQAAALAGELRPTGRPDIDNVVKGIFDACNGVVWRDDRQAVEVRAAKGYGPQAQASVEVWPL